jgi:hypothetical protein
LNTDLRELNHFGAGITLYFVFLKSFALLFLVMFCCNVYATYCNFTGNGGETNWILRTTFANMKPAVSTIKYTESLHNIRKPVESDNSVSVCPCPDGYDPPDEYKKVVDDNPEGCFIDCDLKCYEPKYKSTVAKERYQPPELDMH